MRSERTASLLVALLVPLALTACGNRAAAQPATGSVAPVAASPSSAAASSSLAGTARSSARVSVSPSGSAQAVTGRWTLVSGSGPAGAVVLLPGDDVTLRVTRDEVSGSVACNSYAASLRRPGTDGFSVTDLSVTQVLCAEEGAADLHDAYLTALSLVTTAHADRHRLDLSGEGVSLTFRR
jgi:heat shock protein HslJ